MMPERLSDEALIESLADGAAVDWAALEAAAATSRQRRRYRNLRLVARVAELHRTIVLEDQIPVPTVNRGAGMCDPEEWGHLSIRGRVAAGAFGQIYRAHDPQLRRDVALKLLRGDISAFRPIDRLLTEARTLAKIHHPNVVTVYGADVRDGVPGLWMELVDGQTLDDWIRTNGAMGAGEAAAVGVDLCRALAAVHGAGLVHGDVKAQNVIRENGGRIVLMDFGAGRPQGADAAGVAGTPMYLAPEVLAGEPPTAQSDLYSLGVLLFHLLTASYPFVAADLEGLIAAHADGARTWLRDLRPDLPDPLVQTIERALDPDPARRFATAGQMDRAFHRGAREAVVQDTPARATVPRRRSVTPGFALGAVALLCVVVGLIVWSRRTPAVPPPAKSVAVLPMKSGDTHHPYLADGLHDQLVSTLGQLQSLRVSSRKSVLPFKDSAAPAGELARTLGVDAALESTVTSSEADSPGSPGRVKVHARLLMAGASTPLWDRTFEGALGALPVLQGEIARAVAASIGAAITPDEWESLRRPGQTNRAAEEAYFRGRRELEDYGGAAARRALDDFERALKADAGHAGAHVGAAYAFISLAANGAMTHQKARALALDHVREALKGGDNLAEAHAAMADIAFLYDWNIKAAEEEYRTALDLNPSLAVARNHYAQLLSATGRFDESMAQLASVESIDPDGEPTLPTLLLYYRGDYHAADKAARDALIKRPNLPVLHLLLGRIAEAQGRLAEALDATRQASQLSATGGVPLRVQVVRLEALSGRTALAERHLRELEAEAAGGSVQLTARDMGYIRLAFGDEAGALAAFARAVDERDPSLVWLGVDPRVNSLRQHPQFAALLKQLGLS
jgi:eukaryotic-like serine/threonine-protein kinase